MLVYNTLFSRILQEGNAYFLENFYRGGTRRFPALADRGARTAAGGFGPNGAAPFPAPADRGTRTAAGGFAPNGRGVFR